MQAHVVSLKDGHTDAPTPTRRTVDALTRTMHALLALSFAGAYVSAESEIFRWVHVSLGYTLGGLLVARVLWGVWGPRHVRWSALWGKLRGLGDWMHGVRAGQIHWLQAQNLYMALSVMTIMLAIAPVVLSGYVTYQEWTGEWMEDVHEFFGNFMLLAVLAHIFGVVLISMLRRRNLAKPMLTGRIEGSGPDLIKANHRVLAALLLAVVLGFWSMSWQSASQFQAALGVSALNLSPGKAQSQSDED
jgi:cytochrome b